jgi:hypothetical protein
MHRQLVHGRAAHLIPGAVLFVLVALCCAACKSDPPANPDVNTVPPGSTVVTSPSVTFGPPPSK